MHRRIASLDGLRAFAVLLVFAHHADQPRVPGGFLGVDLFFALSGYLITGLLISERERTGGLKLRRFYLKRFLRLMPALASMVVGVVTLGLLTNYGVGLRNGVVAVTYTMDLVSPATHDNGGALGHTWSLAVEEQFYLLWPALVLLAVTRRRVAGVTAPIAALSVIATAIYLTQDSWLWVYRSPLTHLPVLAAGAALGALPADRWQRFVRPLAVPTLVVLGLLAASAFVEEQQRWLYVGGLLLVGVLSAALIGHLVTARGPVTRMFESRPLVWLGERSYGFYLWHYPVLVFAGHWLHSVVASAVVGLFVTLAFTELSWRYVEQPFLRRKERLGTAGVVELAEEHPDQGAALSR